MNDAYELVSFRGKTFDRITAQALAKMEERLGYELTVVQGSYNGGVGASAGTHDGGGAVDLVPFDWENKVRVGREIGFAMWHRSPQEGPWGEHVHGILIGNQKLSPSARDQVISFRMGRNGLKNQASDTFWRPAVIKLYRFVPDKIFAIQLANIQVDFLNAIDGKSNKATRRGRIIQRILNRKIDAGLLVDGEIGPRTVEAWRKWERKMGVSGRAGVPDRDTLRALFRWTIYFVAK